jgi:hypothetical protein
VNGKFAPCGTRSRSGVRACFHGQNSRTGGCSSALARSDAGWLPFHQVGSSRATCSSRAGVTMLSLHPDLFIARRTKLNFGLRFDGGSVAKGTASAQDSGMSLKTFRAADGVTWTVWRVEAGSATVVPGTPSVWLAFQNEDGSERRRLINFPDDWSQRSEQLLDLLRRMAEPVVSWRRPSPPGGVERLRSESGSDANE